MTSLPGFIGVHVGAGHHSLKKTKEYKLTCKKACLKANDILQESGSVVEAVAAAVVVLEDATCTNAGFGSNLTIKGNIECDACIMEGNLRCFGAVGAMPGIKNPILVAKQLLIEQDKGCLSLGRIRPNFLVGEGAKEWAVQNGIPEVPNQSLVSENAMHLYKHYIKKIDSSQRYKKRRLEDICNLNQNIISDPIDACNSEAFSGEASLEGVSDTVGAICIDSEGRVASAVSSGGFILKQPGRVGQAAVVGSGCWSENAISDKDAVAVSTTGCGESLIRTFFAKSCANLISQNEIPTVALQLMFQENILSSSSLLTNSEKMAGCICIKFNKQEKRGEFLWAHTTDSMCIGLMSTNDRKPKSRMSRLPTEVISGQTVVIEGTQINLTKTSR